MDTCLSTPLLEAAAEVPPVPAAALLDGRSSLVVIAPHPDDETLGCGTLLHAAAANGLPCRVICMTDGSASHPRSRAWPPMRLAALRRAEIATALGVLAPAAALDWLGYPDCGLPTGDDAAIAIARLAALVPPGALVVAAWSGDPHIDHQRSAALVTGALRDRPDVARLAYPIWGRFAASPAPEGLQVLAASPEARAAKRKALACHASQMTGLIADDPEGFVMTAADQAHFLAHPEIFHAGP